MYNVLNQSTLACSRNSKKAAVCAVQQCAEELAKRKGDRFIESI